jgi:sulfate-transporting ATPase
MTHWATKFLPSGYEGGWAQATPFVTVMVVLLLQRDRAANRRAAQATLPVAMGRVNLLWPAIGVAGTAVLATVLEPRWLDALIVTLAFGILALSLVVLIGYANQISLAQMAIAGLGALCAAQLNMHLGLPFELAPAAGALVGALCGVLVGLPALRIRGSNLAVVTIGLGLAVTNVIFVNAAYTGGFEGLTPDRPTFLGIAVDAGSHPNRYALVVLGWFAVALATVVALRRSRFGRRLVVMRSNERAAGALGIDVARAKLAAFVVSCSIAGLGGVLLSFRQSSITFAEYSFMDSINLVIVTAVAGIGSVLGAVVAGVSVAGGVFYRIIDDLGVDAVQNNYQLFFGLALCLTVVVHPNGVVWRRARRPDPVRFGPGAVEPAEPAALQVRDGSVAFGGVQAVAGVSLEVRPGEVVGLVGPNGAGKTTLLDGICGFAAMQGSVSLDDVALTRLGPDRRSRAGIGRVFQGGELIEDLSASENLLAAAENLAGDGRRLAPGALSVREHFELGQPDQRPAELSLAQRRLVALERALAGNPRVLLLDEPGAGLSMTDTTALADELRRLAQEHDLGILLVDHDMVLVMSACDRLIVLQDGAVLASGTPTDIQQHPAVRAAYLGDAAPWLVEHAPDVDGALPEDP